jgi:Family of unknown function (DUF6166)
VRRSGAKGTVVAMLSLKRTPVQRRRFYVGRVESSHPAVFVVGDAVRRLDGAFDWGTDDPGSRKLAAGLLRDASGRRPSSERVGRFLHDVVARLPADGFVLAADYVEHWA